MPAVRQSELQEKIDGVIEREFRRSTLRKNGGKCDGPCVGVGSASTSVDGKCPSPCNATKFTEDLIKQAKLAAKRAANRKCFEKSQDDDCVCKEDPDGYSEVKRQCYNGYNDDGSAYCIYEIYYKFTSTCSKG